MFSAAHQNPMGFTKLKRMVKMKTSSGEEERPTKRMIEGFRNPRTLDSNKENRTIIRNELKRNSQTCEDCDQRYTKSRGGLHLVSKENELYKNVYKSAFKLMGNDLELQPLRDSIINERTKLDRIPNQDRYNQLNQNTSLKMKTSVTRGINEISIDMRNITDRKFGYQNLAARRIQKIKSYNSNKVKTQRESFQPNRKQIFFQTSSIKGSKEFNQDSIKTGDNAWIVCDGHGEHGHNVSWYTSNVLYELYQERRAKENFSKAMLRDVFVEVERNLEESGIDLLLSGSTCVMVVLEGERIYCACVGDSVAIAIYEDQSYEVLSSEHKPYNPEEAKRIQFFGGIIKKTVGKENLPGSPYRMWGQGVDQWGPGLAISRSFGDKMAQKYGLIYEPEIKQIQLQKSLKYIVLGSDGLFDQVTPTEMVNILSIQAEQEIHEACKMLADIAQSRWIGYSDDISAVVVYF